ncbi:MAG: hypothetical protein HKN01_08250, partial [Acidimicrobiia bacterium]|nr:hypothetical protein [Acidimicrobiia bacterium]
MTTIRNWIRNGTDRITLIWSEPLSWLVLLLGLGWAVMAWRRERSAPKFVSIVAISMWLVAALALTVYPLDNLEAPQANRFELKNFVPFWGLAEAFDQADGYLMS